MNLFYYCFQLIIILKFPSLFDHFQISGLHFCPIFGFQKSQARINWRNQSLNYFQRLQSFQTVKVFTAQSCPTLLDPMDCNLPGSPAMEFFRQEYWSGLPFPSSGHQSQVSALQGDSLLSKPLGKPNHIIQFSSVYFSCSVVSDSLRPHELQHAMPPCPSPTPGVQSNSCPSSQ